MAGSTPWHDESLSIGATLRRGLRVLRAGIRHVLLPNIRGDHRQRRAEHLQTALEELGGTWIKLGQSLALRFDLLPSDYCLQLFQLLNQVRPFPAEEVREVIEQELHRPVEDLFRLFDWQPVAAASIGQVHRAELPDGTPVAVKVQRPGIRALARADLRLMRWIALVLDTVPFATTINARALVDEFARWTEEELDYRMEARHAIRLRANAADDPIEYNAKIFPQYTTSRVLTLEFLSGTSVLEIITALRDHPETAHTFLAERGHDPRRIASHLIWNGLNQIYRTGYFHADPHPANLIVLPGDQIGYVDFGIVGKLDQRTTRSLRYFAQHLFAGEVEAAVDEFLRFLVPSTRTDVHTARRDLIMVLEQYLEKTGVSEPFPDQGSDAFEIQMLATVRRHGMTLSPSAARYLKAVITTDAMVKQLDPEFDLHGHENRFFQRLIQLELGEKLTPGGVVRWFTDFRVRLDRLLELGDVVRTSPGGLAEGLAGELRRRMRILTALAIAGWFAVLAMLFR